MVSALGGFLRSRGFAAIVAQVWQALGTFGLQLVAAWVLGAAGLGMLSLCLGMIVLAAAIASGMVGDSLTVLDRHDRRIRAGLEFWALCLILISAVTAGIGTWMSGLLPGGQALLFALALAAFQLEELVRRLYTATMRFWRLMIIDGAAVTTALAVLGAVGLFARIDLGSFLLGLAAGQFAGIVVGVCMLPAAERRLVSLRGAAVRAVAGFGAWRGAQVAVPQVILTSVRVMVTATVGAAALGQVEAARIFVAPAMLAVQGLGSYLLASYVRDRGADLRVLTRRAWHATVGMTVLAVLAGVVIVLAAPLVGPKVLGPNVRVDPVAVIGWSLWVAGSASLQPFASLAAAKGRPALVFACRSVDALVAIVASWVLLVPLAVSPSWMPFALAGGLFLGGLLVRQLVLKPLYRQPATSPDVQARTSYAT
jgi:O-antigen/teichoic acid export membrane protein